MATAKTAKKDRHLRHAEYYGLTETFDDLYARSKAQAVFTDLMPLILSEENIRLAYRNIKRNTGSRTAGVDHLTMSHIGKLSSEKDVSKVRHKLAWYNPNLSGGWKSPNPMGKPALWVFRQSGTDWYSNVSCRFWNRYARPNSITEATAFVQIGQRSTQSPRP